MPIRYIKRIVMSCVICFVFLSGSYHRLFSPFCQGEKTQDREKQMSFFISGRDKQTGISILMANESQLWLMTVERREIKEIITRMLSSKIFVLSRGDDTPSHFNILYFNLLLLLLSLSFTLSTFTYIKEPNSLKNYKSKT